MRAMVQKYKENVKWQRKWRKYWAECHEMPLERQQLFSRTAAVFEPIGSSFLAGR